MNNSYWMNDWYSYLGKLPDLLLALLVLLIGWIIAKLIEKAVYGILKKTNIDQKLFTNENRANRKWSTEKIISKIIFYILLVFVFIAFFNILQLSFIATPLVNMLSTMTAFVPNLLKAALILLLGWVIASILKMLIIKLGNKGFIKNTLTRSKLVQYDHQMDQTINNAARIVFYLVLLIFLPGVLSALDITGVSGPFSDMVNNFLTFIPKLFAAILLLAVGWFVAKLVRDIVTNFLFTIGMERIAKKLGLSKLFQGTTLSSVVGTIVYILILIPVVISALDQLDIRGISDPAIAMLNNILTMLPNIAIAIVLILVGIFTGKWVGNIVAQLLNRVGFNSLLNNMGIGNSNTSQPDPLQNKTTLSDLVGNTIQILIVFLLTVEALQILQLDFLVVLATGVLAYLPHVLVSVIIVGFGFYLGKLVKNLLSNVIGSKSLQFLSTLSKYAIIALSFFMALDQLKIADSIINLAFMLILGGLALAFGLAFGLGGREFASKYLAKLDKNIEKESNSNNRNNGYFPPNKY